MKMLVHFTEQTGNLNANQLEYCVKRNFDGYGEDIQAMDYFRQCSSDLPSSDAPKLPTDAKGMVMSSLSGEHTKSLKYVKGW